MPEPLTEDLIHEAIAYLDFILEEHTVRFVHLDRAELVERIEAVRVDAISCRAILAERKSLRVE